VIIGTEDICKMVGKKRRDVRVMVKHHTESSTHLHEKPDDRLHLSGQECVPHVQISLSKRELKQSEGFERLETQLLTSSCLNRWFTFPFKQPEDVAYEEYTPI
jgi:hypothetical protein